MRDDFYLAGIQPHKISQTSCFAKLAIFIPFMRGLHNIGDIDYICHCKLLYLFDIKEEG